jgi:hypothetical protein
VQVQKSRDLGVAYHRAGEGVFLTDHVPPEGFSGPPLPKEPVEDKKPRKPVERPRPEPAGTFSLDPESFAKRRRGRPERSRRKEADWKKERKRARKIKERW